MRATTTPALLAATIFCASPARFAAAQPPDAAPVTFAETIAPILHAHCAQCHRPGEIGPFPLLTYADAVRRGARIAEVTASRAMPPWQPARGHVGIVGERGLDDAQIAAIAAWVDQGMPIGDPARVPAPPEFPDGWRLGEPDLVLEMPAGYDLPADGADVYRNFAIPTGLAENRWVRAIELRSSARSAAHHALFAYVEHGRFADRDGTDGAPGFGGSMAVGFVPGQRSSGSLGGWAVGGRGMVFPDGMAVSLPAGTDFLLQMHFHPSGEPQTERARVGLYFSDTPPEKAIASLELPALFGFGAGIDIPAGEPDYVVRDAFTLPADVLAHSVWGHAHYLGKALRIDATLPDGEKTTLFDIPDWRFNWQEIYRFETPVPLPAGTRVEATIRYDNSAANPRNPHAPPRRVRWGLESVDEMGTIGLLLEIPDADDAPALRETLNARTQTAIQDALEDGTVDRYLSQQAALNAAGE